MIDMYKPHDATFMRRGGQYAAKSVDIIEQMADCRSYVQFFFLLLQLMFILVFQLKAEIIGLLDTNQRLDEEKQRLFEDNQRLDEENKRLFELAHLGSDTSGIPSGKDWKKNGASMEIGNTTDGDAQSDEICRETPTSITPYLKNRSGERKRQGGQKNHSPSFMHIPDAQEREPILHYPTSCIRCPNFEQCKADGRFRKCSTSHGYDIEVVRVHREHWQFEATDCLRDGSRIREDFPEIIGAQYYEANIQLHVLTWHHLFHGSYEQIGLAAKELLGLSLSAGTANAIVKRASARMLGSRFMDALRFFILIFEKVFGVDETSANVGGRNAWVHTAATASVTLLTAHWKRGYEGAIYSGVLQFYIYRLISDCWAPYFKKELRCSHAICDGHILRELVAAAYFRAQAWAISMFDLLIEIFTAKEDAIERGEKELPIVYIDDVRMRYRQIVADGFASNAGKTKGKTISLLERLQKLEDAALAFAVDFSVDFTNNVSEISLRNLKVALRVAGQFKTMSGLGDYCIIQSFMDTCRKQGHNPFDMLRILLSGGDIIMAVFGSEKAAVLKQMISLTDTASGMTADEIGAALSDICPNEMSEELIAAVSYRRYKVCDHPPPEKKKPTVPKDKMQEARELEELRKWSRSRQSAKQGVATSQGAG